MTIRSADFILVLQNDCIIESGKHDTLYDADGVYAQMYRQQFWLDDLAEREAAPVMATPNGEPGEPEEAGSVIL